MNNTDRFDRLDAFIREGRVIRHDWRDTDAEGRERACLLAALSPEAGEAERASACPTSVLPPWLARLTPLMDDNGTEAAWPSLVQRYARVVRRAAETLDDAGWRRAEYRALAAVVREAMSHTDDDASLAACRAVVVLCERVVGGDEPGADEWEQARAAAKATTWVAAEAAWAAAAWAAEAAAWAAGATAEATSVEAEQEAWDHMSAAVLDAIESECQASIEPTDAIENEKGD